MEKNTDPGGEKTKPIQTQIDFWVAGNAELTGARPISAPAADDQKRDVWMSRVANGLTSGLVRHRIAPQFMVLSWSIWYGGNQAED